MTATIELREVVKASVGEVCRLAVAPSQTHLVAPNAVSIAQAYFEPAAWFRAVYANDTAVGFAMLYDPTRTDAPEDGPDVCWLWRFMIDARFQRQGHGAGALALLVEHVSTLRVARFALSYVPEPGNASALYSRAGFVPTGEMEDGEAVMELLLAGR